MRFTHFYDLLIRFSSFIGGIMIVAAGADILDPVSSRIEQEILNHGWTWLWIIIMWAYIIVGFIGAVRLLTEPSFLTGFYFSLCQIHSVHENKPRGGRPVKLFI